MEAVPSSCSRFWHLQMAVETHSYILNITTFKTENLPTLQPTPRGSPVPDTTDAPPSLQFCMFRNVPDMQSQGSNRLCVASFSEHQLLLHRCPPLWVTAERPTGVPTVCVTVIPRGRPVSPEAEDVASVWPWGFPFSETHSLPLPTFLSCGPFLTNLENYSVCVLCHSMHS